MVRHIIIWNYQEALSEAEREEAGKKIKASLEALVGRIPGLLELQIVTDPLPSGNGDLMLFSSFIDADALAGYQIHPEHAAASQFVKSVTCNRMCMDYMDSENK